MPSPSPNGASGRDGRLAGAEHSRSLRQLEGNVWELGRDYPQFEE